MERLKAKQKEEKTPTNLGDFEDEPPKNLVERLKTLIFDTLQTEFKNYATKMLTTKKEFLDLK